MHSAARILHLTPCSNTQPPPISAPLCCATAARLSGARCRRTSVTWYPLRASRRFTGHAHAAEAGAALARTDETAQTLSNTAPVHPVPASWLHFGEMRHAGRGELSCFLPSRRDPRTLQSEGYRTDPIIHITHRHRHFRLACQCTLGASRIFAEMPVRREC